LIFAKVTAEHQQQLLHRYLQLSQRSTRTALYCRSIYFTTAGWWPLKKKKNPGALGMCPVCPLVKTALTAVDQQQLRRSTALSSKHEQCRVVI